MHAPKNAAGREIPNRLSLPDRIALQFWDSLTELEQSRSPMGPPEWPLRRWMRFTGRSEADWRSWARPIVIAPGRHT